MNSRATMLRFFAAFVLLSNIAMEAGKLPSFASPSLYEERGLEEVLIPRSIPEKPLHTKLNSDAVSDLIIVRFIEDSNVRLRTDGLVSLSGEDLSSLKSTLSDYPLVAVERLYSRPENQLDMERSELEERSGRELADKNLAFLIRLAGMGREQTEVLIDTLNTNPLVEIAYAPSQIMNPAVVVQSARGDYTNQQGYLGPATENGIDARWAWTQPGGRGQDVTIIDLENGWNIQHEDLTKARNTLLTPSAGDLNSKNHGAAVLGQMIADDNQFGVTGIVPDAMVKMVSWSTNDSGLTAPQAIDRAAQELESGDVMLLEGQVSGPQGTGPCGAEGQDGCVPVEWEPETYNEVVFTVAKGIVVIEAAGNGGNNLDDAVYAGRFSRNRDSGAILVGAGYPTGSCSGGICYQARERMVYSNYGSRVDLQGWGESVTTTGYGYLYPGGASPNPNLENQFYTSTFAGTSAASPIVAGAIAALQGITKQRSGMALLPAQVRTILVSTGTPQTGDTSKHIGPLPSLLRAAGCPQSGGVILYWNKDYDCTNGDGDPGYRQRTTTGWQNINDGAFNDRASSLKVPPGWSVKLYEKENRDGSGGSVCRNSDDSDFAGDTFTNGVGLNDQVSSVEVFANGNCSAAPPPPPCYTLTKTVSPSGGGSITANPSSSGSCPSGQYTSGTTVELTANPASNYQFLYWSGTNNNSINPTTVTIYGNTSVTVHFEPIIQKPWHAKFYRGETCWLDPNCTETPKCEADYQSLDINWGQEEPCADLGQAWVGDFRANNVDFADNWYVFLVESDGATRFWLNENVIMAAGSSRSCPERRISGNNNLRLILKEDGGEARVKLTWTTDTNVCDSPPPSPSLSASPTSVTEGQSIDVSWSNLEPTNNDRIGLYTETAPDSTDIERKTISGSLGTITFQAPESSGRYNFRLFRNGVRVAVSNVVAVQGITCNDKPPVLIEPIDGATLDSHTITFRWNAISGCTFDGYDLRVYDSGGANAFGPETVYDTQKTVTLDSSWNNKPLYWSVRAANAPMGSVWANQRYFQIVPGSPCGPPPQLVEPIDGYTSATHTITFRWSAISGCTFNGYELLIKDAPFYDSGGNIVRDETVYDTQKTVTLESLWDNKPLYWRVRAANAPAGAEWANQRYFQIVPAPEPAPLPVLPLDQATLTNRNVSFQWDIPSESSYNRYVLRVKDVPDMETGGTTYLNTEVDSTTFSCVFNGTALCGNPAENTVLYWSVRSVSGASSSAWTPVQRFHFEPGFVAGRVTLQGRATGASEAWIVPLQITLYLPSETTPQYAFAVTTDESGQFGIPNVAAGVYDIRVKGSHTLSAMKRSVRIVAGAPLIDIGLLPDGDANGDNRVDSEDHDLLVTAFGKHRGEPGHDSRTDFNGDGAINIIDYNILQGNYLRSGDSPSEAPSDSWRGEYFDNESLSGSPVLVRQDPNIDFDWAINSPSPEISADGFSVRWTRKIEFEEGLYRFTTTTDDGVRLYIDGTSLIDEWRPMAATSFTAETYLSAGTHTLAMDYFERVGQAVAHLEWSKLGSFGGAFSVRYQVSAVGLGWLPGAQDGTSAGTEGQLRPLEAVVIDLENAPEGATIQYRVHMQGHGWMPPVNEGEVAGFPGSGLRMEAIQVYMVGWPSDKLLQYDAHVQSYGWMGWIDSPYRAGTEGQSLRVEALKLRIIPNVIVQEIQYDTHVQDIAWTGWRHQDDLAGTVAQSRRIEALRARLMALPDTQVEYQVWIEGQGWTDWIRGPNNAGTTGQSRRIEAMRVRLVNPPEGMRVCYQAYMQNEAWIDQVCDGETSGYPGEGRRMEAIKMQLVE